MTYLLLFAAIVANGIQSTVFKGCSSRVKNINTYTYTGLVALFSMLFFAVAGMGRFEFNAGSSLYSAAFAVFYIMSVLGNAKAIESGPLSLSTLVLQCSLIIPTVYGFFVLKEEISVFAKIGIILIFLCLVLVNPSGKNEKIPAKWYVWVTLSFIGNGMCSTVQKMQQLKFDGAYKSEFMITALLVVTVVMLLLGLTGERGKTGKIVKYAAAQGVSNGALNMLVMLLTALLPTAVLFPAVLSGGMIIAFAASVIIFKEKLTARQYIGYGIGVISVILSSL